MSENKKPSLRYSILISISVFSFMIPIAFIFQILGNTSQYYKSGGVIFRGGPRKVCQSGDYDAFNGGYNCDGGYEIVNEPSRMLSWSEALGEDLPVYIRLLTFTTITGGVFGVYYWKEKQKE